MPRDKVFISYRRSDAAADTTALRQSLVARFGEEAIFNDVTGIEPGAAFPNVLEEELAQAAVVLAVMGKGWLLATNEWNQRRIDLPGDWVTVELTSALGDPEVTVIPVLIGDAPMPPGAALPASLRPLAARNAVRLRHDDWEASLTRLFDTLAEVLGDDGEGSAALDGGEGAPESGEAAPSLDTIRRVVLDAVRQGVAEAMAAAAAPTERELVGALTEVAGALTAGPADGPAIEEVLERLVGQPAAEVHEHASGLFPYTFSHNTDNGVWAGYAAEYTTYANGDVDRYQGCLLLLPDARSRIGGACVVGTVLHIDMSLPGAPGKLEGVIAQVGTPPGTTTRQW